MRRSDLGRVMTGGVLRPGARRARGRGRGGLKTLWPGFVVPFTPPPAGEVSVVAVTVYSNDALLWEFSAAVSAVGANCPQLQAADAGGGGGGGEGGGGGGGGFVGPVETVSGGVAAVLATYAGVDFAEGGLFRVVAAPAGLTFAAGPLALPQEGAIGG